MEPKDLKELEVEAMLTALRHQDQRAVLAIAFASLQGYPPVPVTEGDGQTDATD